MVKRIVLCLMGLALSSMLCGCWNYRSMDQMSIVVGIAVDFDEQNQLFELSYEVANLAGRDKKSTIPGKVIQSTGKTMFDAARNAKRRETNKLFFGSSHILVISEQIAREQGIIPVTEWFLRDVECRETMDVAISQEDTAAAILDSPEQEDRILSVVLHNLIREDPDVTASSVPAPLYQVYNELNSPGRATLLPALRKEGTEDEPTLELNGAAILKEDKLIGFLTPEQTKYALFINNQVGSGILTLSMADMLTDDISLEIMDNQTDMTYTIDQDTITVKIKTRTKLALGENAAQINLLVVDQIQKIETAAEDLIAANITHLIEQMQHQYQSDVFGFGDMIYRHDYAIWKQLEPNWDEVFQTLRIEVASHVDIVNSAFIK